MQKDKMNISIVGYSYKGEEPWHLDHQVDILLKEIVDKLGYLQCSYRDKFIVYSQSGKAVFDQSGNLIELYQRGEDEGDKRVNKSKSKELEFEMILLFSKINE